jgi:hypothetical protein
VPSTRGTSRSPNRAAWAERNPGDSGSRRGPAGPAPYRAGQRAGCDRRQVLGHGGELIPFLLDRIDRQFTGLSRPPSWYLLNHVWITTSGLFSLPPLLCALQVFGVDRVLFAVDYPFSPNEAGRAVLDALPLSPADRTKVAADNADTLFGLPLPRR